MTSPNLRTLLEPVVEQALQLLDASEAGLYIYDEPSDELELTVECSAVEAPETITQYLGIRLARHEGVAGEVLERGTSVRVQHYASENPPEAYRRFPWTAAMGAPLVHEGTFVGVLSIASRQEGRAFTDTDRVLLERFADQAALTVLHAQALARERHHHHVLRRLHELSQQWLQRTDPDELLADILNAALELLDCPGGGLFLFDARREELELKASRHDLAGLPQTGIRMGLGEGVSGRVAQTGRPERVTDYRTWAHQDPRWADYGIRSAVGVPLHVGSRLIGVLSFYAWASDVFTDSHVDLGQLLGDQAAIAIHQAEMAELTRRFQQIGAQMLRTSERTGLSDVLESVAHAIVDHSPFQVAAISVFGHSTPLDHPTPPDVWSVHVVGLPPEPEAELRQRAAEGDVIPNRSIVTQGHPIGEGYYVTPEVLPEAATAGVPTGEAEAAETTRARTWGPHDTFVYFLKLGERAIGRITLAEPVHGTVPTPAELEPVEGFVSAAAVAVQRARYQTRLQSLYRFSQELGTQESLEDLYEAVLDPSEELRLIQCDYAAILRLNPDGEGLTLEAQTGWASCPYPIRGTIPLETGVTGWVARHRASQLVPDVGKDPRFIQGSVAMGSELAVPIRMGETLLGVLNAESRRTYAFDEEDRELMEALADQVAVAISNLERRERLERYQRRLRGIYRLSEELTRLNDLDDLCDRASELISENLQYDHVIVLDREGDRLVPRGLRTHLPEAELRADVLEHANIHMGLTGWAVRHAASARVDDVTRSVHYETVHPDIASELVVPIVESDEVLGVLNVESVQPAAFTEMDRELLEAMARQLGVAMRSLQNRERVEELNAFLRELNETEDVDELLTRMLRRAMALLGPKAEGGSVMFYDEGHDRFEFRTAIGRDIDRLRRVHYTSDELRRIIRMDGPTLLTHSSQYANADTHRIGEMTGYEAPASTLALPIRDTDRNRIVAVLLLNNFHEEGIFDSEDAERLGELGEEITAALLRARDREQLHHRATHDALTGAHNRHYLYAFLQQEQERAQRYGHPLSLVMIDVDGFFEVNDRFGHAEGDRVLQALARLIRQNVRDVDRVVRYGGDEFVVLMPETDSASAEEAMHRLQTIVESWDPGLADLTLGFSFGVASWTPDDEEPPEAMLSEADAFMYRRRTGRPERRAAKREITEVRVEREEPAESESYPD